MDFMESYFFIAKNKSVYSLILWECEFRDNPRILGVATKTVIFDHNILKY